MVDHKCKQLEWDILSLQVRLGGLGFTNPTQNANAELQASVNVTAPLAERTMSQQHEPPDEAEVTLLQQKGKKEKEEKLLKRSDEWRNSLPREAPDQISNIKDIDVDVELARSNVK